MKPIPFTWDFKIKDTAGTIEDILYKERCCLRGDEQKTIEILILKCSMHPSSDMRPFVYSP